MWISFDGRDWHPSAVKVAVGIVNALTGDPWHDRLSRTEQDYLVCPDQPWIDGIKSADGEIRQFIAMPLGMGYSVEGQVTGEERFGGLQLATYSAKKGRFPTKHGYPWYALYDETKGDVGVSDTLAGVQTVKELDAQNGLSSQQDDATIPVPENQILDAKPHRHS